MTPIRMAFDDSEDHSYAVGSLSNLTFREIQHVLATIR